MYCRNCGKEINGVASFCPYCGAKTTVMMPEPEKERLNWVLNESNDNESEELPVYMRKNKAAFCVGFIPLIYAIIHCSILCVRLLGMG